MEIDYYKINETLNYRCYQIPQELFESSIYKDKLDLASKILYGFILDRLSLSAKNNWCDKNGNIYLIFTREEAGDKLNLSPKTITKAFKQLSDEKEKEIASNDNKIKQSLIKKILEQQQKIAEQEAKLKEIEAQRDEI